VRVDVVDELAVIRSWRDVQAPGETRDAMVAGFLWALALVGDLDVSELRARLDTPRDPAAAFQPVAPLVSAAPAVPVTVLPDPALPWPGLGIARIERTREAGDGPVSSARAFTAGPNGRPVALSSSYAEMAAETSGLARGLSDDSAALETGVDVPVDTTT
jgi:hypothetical protein